MWLHKLALVLLVVGSALSQETVNENDKIRRLRFRRPRPRPKVIGIEPEDGIAEGLPTPLRVAQQDNTAKLLAAALQEEQDDNRFSSPSANSALESLLATAAQGPVVVDEPQPVAVPVEEVVAAVVQEEEAPLVVPNARRPGGRRRPPGIPRRRRPRPQQAAEAAVEGGEEEVAAKGGRRPTRPNENPVQTVERYSHMNDDGSFTFGYIAEDGSFREETRGVDCITRGKYGYIDPEGKKREFTYVSGLPCEVGEEGAAAADDDQLQTVEDPIDPAERFRTAQVVQLSADEIPESAKPRRVPVARRPAPAAANAAVAGRPRDPALASRRPRPQQNGTPLQTLFQIADEEAAASLPPTPRPAARPARPLRPRPAAARPASPAAAIDFDQELGNFNLNRPALTFSPASPAAPGAAPAPVGPSFSSELVFNPATGTFQTELRQQVGGEQGEIRVTNENAPAGRPTPTPTPAARPPTPAAAVQTTFSATPIPTSARPGTPFTAFTPARPGTPTPTPGAPVAFQPLNFPDPSSAPRPASPTPAAVSPASPTPTASRPVPSPTPTPSLVPTPIPSRPASPTPTAAGPVPASPSPASSFFFTPFRTVGTPRPVAPGQPATPRPFTAFGPITPTAARPEAPRTAQPAAQPAPQPFPVAQPAARPAPQPAIRPAPQPALRPAPQPAIRPAPQPAIRPVPQPQPTPQVQAARPPAPPQPRPVPSAPQLQFGFTPVGQQQQQGARPQPFTAFAAGTPPQLRGAPQGRPSNPAFAPRPQQLGIPPQLQGQPGARFVPFGRPPAQPQPQPFSVFNPNQFRGARA